MSDITLDEVKKLAKLSRIHITDEEAKAFRNEFEGILKYVDQLNEIDTKGVEPTSQVTGLENISRPDEIRKYPAGNKELLEGSPKQRDGYIEVKKVL